MDVSLNDHDTVWLTKPMSERECIYQQCTITPAEHAVGFTDGESSYTSYCCLSCLESFAATLDAFDAEGFWEIDVPYRIEGSVAYRAAPEPLSESAVCLACERPIEEWVDAFDIAERFDDHHVMFHEECRHAIVRTLDTVWDVAPDTLLADVLKS